LIGVYGGTFDPVHEGHLGTAREAAELAGCGRVLMIPAAVPPGKIVPRASAQQRLEMLRLAVADQPRLQADGCELERAGPSFTVKTLQMLRQRESESLLLILGSDAFLNLEQWWCWRELFQLAHILVAGRPGTVCKPEGALAEEIAPRQVASAQQLQLSGHGRVLETVLTQYPVSSTRIRAELSQGKRPAGLPAAVADYINDFNLYSD